MKIYLPPLKYSLALIIPMFAFISFSSTGWITFIPVVTIFGGIPILELFLAPKSNNLNEAQELVAKKNHIFDILLYVMVPIQYALLVFFLFSLKENIDPITIIGRLLSMAILCGVLGINVGHELGHRKNKMEQWMAKALLLTSLYMHFFIEHNRGHHKNVSTEIDPSSARKGEILFTFWVRSVFQSYLSAWELERERLKKNNHPFFSIKNEMIVFQVIQALLLILIFLFFGWEILIYFTLGAIGGFLLLETVNYIEHYGLSRRKLENGYERVLPIHSWNSNHPIGRLVLFELSRHSDHHYIASRKYQLLRHMNESPQMPTGYPGMMLLALIPPLWFLIMNKRVTEYQNAGQLFSAKA